MHSIIDHYFRELCELGAGAGVKHTSVSKDEETKLWESRVVGVDSPQALLNNVFWQRPSLKRWQKA